MNAKKSGVAMKTEPGYKATPATGLFLINPERHGVLILDQQNVAGQFDRLGFRKLDPRWYLNMAHRVTNLERAVAVADLQAVNPLTNQNYLATSWIWDKYGYWITHVPARRIMLMQNADEIGADQTISENQENSIYKRKDMTDAAVRDSIQIWSSLPNVTHILLASHDSDFARDVKTASWAKGKKVTLLTVGNDTIATTLREAVDDVIDVLGYAPGYSAYALNKRGWWRASEPVDMRRQKIQRWFQTDGIYPRYLENQLKDMQLLFQYMIHDLQLVPPGSSPDAKRLSLGRLKLALHNFMICEKSIAKLEMPISADPTVSKYSLEAQDTQILPAQARACDESLGTLIRTLVDSEVLLFERDDPYPTKLYYLNTAHPAVQITLELSFA
jgi:hypothetical protein